MTNRKAKFGTVLLIFLAAVHAEARSMIACPSSDPDRQICQLQSAVASLKGQQAATLRALCVAQYRAEKPNWRRDACAPGVVTVTGMSAAICFPGGKKDDVRRFQGYSDENGDYYSEYASESDPQIGGDMRIQFKCDGKNWVLVK